MKNTPIILLILLSLILFTRCSNDVDINADYEEFIVVYGILDPDDDTTFLKINKAFLGPDNALIMAKVPDSSQFTEKLDVRIREYNDVNNNDFNEYTFDTISINNKEEGDFYNPNQILYYNPLDPRTDTLYELYINYKDTEISSQTTTFKFTQFDITSPGFAQKIRIDNTFDSRPVIWNRKDEAPRYDVSIRFNYKELMEGSPDTVYRSFIWFRDMQKSFVGEEVESYYTGSSFYAALEENVIYDDPAVEEKVTDRFTGKVEFIVEAGGTELNTYMEVNEPSSSIIQDRPEYSNIENGIGIFSCRMRAIKTKKLNDLTVAYLKENYFSMKFRF